MNDKIPSEKLEHVVDIFFDKENEVINVTGFNSECIIQTDYKIEKGKYKIIRDLYQLITKEHFEYFLKKNKNPKHCWASINNLILAGISSASICNLDKKESHKLHNDETGKDYYTTASRI